MVAENLDRHLAHGQGMAPARLRAVGEGRDFAFLGGEDWAPEQSRLDETAKAAMIVNLLTEDNLPSYHREIATRFGRDGAWGTWVGRWTAEENRHGVALRDYLVVTRGVDPVELERARMDYMTTGYDSGDKTPLEAVAYVSFQELATRVSHRNTGRATGDPIADKLLARIATDENLHMVFYRNLVDGGVRHRPRRDDAGRRQRGRSTSRCPAPPWPTSGRTRCSSPRPASTTCGCTTTRSSARSCARGRCSSAPTSAPRASRPARSWPQFLTGLDAQATKFVESRERVPRPRRPPGAGRRPGLSRSRSGRSSARPATP